MNLWELASGPIIPAPPHLRDKFCLGGRERGRKEGGRRLPFSCLAEPIFLEETRQYSFWEKGTGLHAKGQ